jgi:hypothetical protein
MAAPKKVDYDRIEPGWRAGLKSPHQLALEYTAATGVACSHAAIIKHFKKLGIERSLAAKIKAKAEAMVTQAMVTGKVTKETLARDVDIINVGAMELANVQLSHRKDIQRYRNLCDKLLNEIELQTGERITFEELGEMMHKPNDKGIDRLNELYMKSISMPSRVDSAKKLVDTLKTLIGLEREAFGIDERGSLTKSLEDLLESIDGGA